jgi:hypothetical protein
MIIILIVIIQHIKCMFFIPKERYFCSSLKSLFCWNQLQSKYPSTNEGTNTIWYIHNLECYLAMKGNESMKHTTVRWNLENLG